MIEHRPRDPEQLPGASWLRPWLGRADPPLPRPAAPRLRPIRRFWPVAVWHARAAVVAGVPLADFLRARLAGYEARLPVPRSRLPLRVELTAGEIRAVAREDPVPPAAPAIDAALQAWTALEGPSAPTRWAQAQSRLAVLEAAEAGARARADALSLRFASDVARGAVVAAPDPGVPAHELGRPAVRSAAAAVALAALAPAAILAEAWAVALPMLLANGSYPPRLEPGARLVPVALVGGFALAVAVGLLALADATIDALAGAVRGASRVARRRVAAWATLAALAMTAAVTAAAGAPVLHGGVPPAREALLLLALPAGAALALRAARRELRRRDLELAAVLAWDRTRTSALAERARRLEELSWADAALRTASQRAGRARQRAQELRTRAEAAARHLARAAARERQARHRLALSLLGALERDRYEYLRQAAARGLDALAPGTPGARGRPLESRPPPGEHGPSAPGRVAV